MNDVTSTVSHSPTARICLTFALWPAGLYTHTYVFTEERLFRDSPECLCMDRVTVPLTPGRNEPHTSIQYCLRACTITPHSYTYYLRTDGNNDHLQRRGKEGTRRNDRLQLPKCSCYDSKYARSTCVVKVRRRKGLLYATRMFRRTQFCRALA